MLSKLEIIKSKIYKLDELSRLVHQWKLLSKKIVFTNGCFDLLHQGHNSLLLQSAELGNKLIVAINSDSSVKRLKGDSRPIMDEYSRAFNLASHAYVDAVIIFEADTPLELIRVLQPHVLVKGGDYTPDTVVGYEDVLAYGGSVELIPLVEGYSTSAVIDTIKD